MHNNPFTPKTILVTGATGNVGSHLVSELAAAGHRVRALSRNGPSFRQSANVQAFQGDLASPDTLDPALEGVDAVFLLVRAPATKVGPALIRRIRKHSRRLVFLSSSAVRDDVSEQPNIIAQAHIAIEHLIKQADFDWTFLRPGIFANNTVNWWGPQISSGDVVRWPYPNAALAPIDPRDIAAVAARCLVQNGHTAATCLLTGPQSLTQTKMLECIGLAIGRQLRLEEISPEVARQELTAVIPAFVLDILLDFWAKAALEPDAVSDTVSEITGSTARTFREWTMDNGFRFGAAIPGPTTQAHVAGVR